MKDKPPKNLAASIHQKLKNISQECGRDFAEAAKYIERLIRGKGEAASPRAVEQLSRGTGEK